MRLLYYYYYYYYPNNHFDLYNKSTNQTSFVKISRWFISYPADKQTGK